jgi:hypothetical protein
MKLWLVIESNLLIFQNQNLPQSGNLYQNLEYLYKVLFPQIHYSELFIVKTR